MLAGSNLHKWASSPLQASEGKASSVAPETMKTDPDSKAKGENLLLSRQQFFLSRILLLYVGWSQLSR